MLFIKKNTVSQSYFAGYHIGNVACFDTLCCVPPHIQCTCIGIIGLIAAFSVTVVPSLLDYRNFSVQTGTTK